MADDANPHLSNGFTVPGSNFSRTGERTGGNAEDAATNAGEQKARLIEPSPPRMLWQSASRYGL
jgi:hypothetical protein